MSGLFTRLAARARSNEVGSIRPLVGSAYESSPDEASDELAETEDGRSNAAATTTEQANARDELRTAPTPIARGATPTRVSSPRFAPEPLAHPNSYQTIAPALSPAERAQPLVPMSPVPAKTTLHARTDGRAGSKLERRNLEAALSNPSALAELPRIEKEEATPLEDDDLPSDTSERPLFLLTRPRQVRPAEDSILRAPESRDMKTNGTEPAKPVVRVTIGRVEVRVASPTAAVPVRPSNNRHTPLGLEAYLKQRDDKARGGGQ